MLAAAHSLLDSFLSQVEAWGPPVTPEQVELNCVYPEAELGGPSVIPRLALGEEIALSNVN